MRNKTNRLALIALFGFGSTLMSQAQYTVTLLQPPGFTASEAHGIAGGKEIGWGTIGGSQHALTWSGTAASFLDLNPTGASQSFLNGIFGTKEIGYATIAGADHSMLWTGTAASAVDLHALLWTGSAGSAIDLHPLSGFTSTQAFATNGTNQLGFGTTTLGRNHGLLWSGTAASMVDLNPGGFTETYAAGISSTNQVGTGWGTATANRNHAVLWIGTAASAVDLNPSGFLFSQAWSTTGALQTGWAWNNSVTLDMHAFLWNGTAASGINLHSFLPANYSTSLAFGIDSATGNIVGLAHNSTLNRDEAVMWSPVPEPSSLLAIGVLVVGLARRPRKP